MTEQRKTVPDRAISSNRLLLLALVVLIPGIVLVALSVRIVAQEQELAASRAIEARANTVRVLRMSSTVT